MAKGDLSSWHAFMFFAIKMAVRHPKRPIQFKLCTKCGCRYHPAKNSCPRCEYRDNPGQIVAVSQLPWQGSLLLIFLGILCLATMPLHNQMALAEAGKALIYAPLGGLFGLSMRR